jgi:hypothetical protein
MKNYVSAEDWAKIETALMEAQVPFYVSFDAHVNDTMDEITYDKRITIEPFTIQVVKEVK